MNDVDAVVIGGGFYGAAIAVYLAKHRGLLKVVLIEKENGLLSRASYNNQARVHNGYHYPRSFTTAFRSRVNLPKFVRDWPNAIKTDFAKLYAIARSGSKVAPKQFERFCFEIGAKVQQAEPSLQSLFESRLIDKVYLVEEYAFDAEKLAAWALNELEQCGVDVMLSSRVTEVSEASASSLLVKIDNGVSKLETLKTKYLFNCTYSGLNQLAGEFPGTETNLKHEITEMALMNVPSILKDIGITVMDGPFFSLMPFPARDLHTLSHVRYTPHCNWQDERGLDPYMRLDEYTKNSRADRMIRDAARYLPSIIKAKYVESLYEVKTVLVKNEADDGRPILFEKHGELKGCYSVLGGKIDNIYDVLEKLDAEIF